jgi:hypothetical protein
MARFDWLMNQVREVGGLKLMMTLGNRLYNYGGMCQYVRYGPYNINMTSPCYNAS